MELLRHVVCTGYTQGLSSVYYREWVEHITRLTFIHTHPPSHPPTSKLIWDYCHFIIYKGNEIYNANKMSLCLKDEF